ncbi:hypothetical protein M432DRAFT_625529 [Thermoascus aurantiacus ATCC 26904]
MATMMMAKEISLLLLLLCCRHLPVVDAEGFTFPTNDDNVFIVGDVVNVTWDVSTPRLSLYEACNEVLELEHNVTNKYFYLWTANRDIYRESGCVFLLQPRAANGIPSPPNITSPLFGVNKRYSDDPPPTTYNAPAATTSSAATSATTTRSFVSTTTTTTTSSSSSLSSSSSSSFSSSSTSLPPQSTGDTASSSTSTPDQHNVSDSSNGLSTAAKVAIGLGVPLGVLIFILAGWALILYRRRRQRRQFQEKTAIQSDLPPVVVVRGEKGDRHAMSDATTSMAISSTYGDEYEARGERPVSELMGRPLSELQ